MLETGVFSLGVLTDNAQIDVLMPCLVAGDVLDQDDRGVNIKLLSEGDIEGLVAGSCDGRVEDTLQAQLVALERCNGFAEKLLRVLVASFHARHIDLFPLDGHVIGLEDGLDRLRNFRTNTVTCCASHLVPLGRYQTSAFLLLQAHTWDQGNSVLATKLGGLEDVRRHGRVCCSLKSDSASAVFHIGSLRVRVHRAAIEGVWIALLRRAWRESGQRCHVQFFARVDAYLHGVSGEHVGRLVGGGGGVGRRTGGGQHRKRVEQFR